MKSEKFIDPSNNIKLTAASDSPHFPERDEHLVWSQFKKGDEQSLIYIYRKYVNILFNYGSQFSDRKEFVRDCIQELFYELIDRRKYLADVRSIKAYLLSSLKRKILRGLQKEERFQHNEKCMELSFVANSLSISQVFRKEDYAIIEKKLNTLPPQQKEVILLHFYEGLSYADIAEIMNIKIKSARALTYRALESLEKKLSPYKKSLYTLILSAIFTG